MEDSKAKFSTIYYNDIHKLTESNANYRKVLATTPNMQLVVMNLKPGEEIGFEIHPYITQFFRIEKGEGVGIVNNKAYALKEGSVLIVPLNTEHNIINLSKTKPLKLYTIYTPPNHPYDRVQKYKK